MTANAGNSVAAAHRCMSLTCRGKPIRVEKQHTSPSATQLLTDGSHAYGGWHCPSVCRRTYDNSASK